MLRGWLPPGSALPIGSRLQRRSQIPRSLSPGHLRVLFPGSGLRTFPVSSPVRLLGLLSPWRSRASCGPGRAEGMPRTAIRCRQQMERRKNGYARLGVERPLKHDLCVTRWCSVVLISAKCDGHYAASDWKLGLTYNSEAVAQVPPLPPIDLFHFFWFGAVRVPQSLRTLLNHYDSFHSFNPCQQRAVD